MTRKSICLKIRILKESLIRNFMRQKKMMQIKTKELSKMKWEGLI